MADLMKCPFCGGEAETENHHNRYTDWWEVKCTDCNASLNERYEYEFEAVAAWNTRKPMEDVVAELENKELESSSAQTEAIIGMCGASANYYCGEKDAYAKAISIVRGKE